MMCVWGGGQSGISVLCSSTASSGQNMRGGGGLPEMLHSLRGDQKHGVRKRRARRAARVTFFSATLTGLFLN